MSKRYLSAVSIIVACQLAACSTGGSFDQLRGRMLNNLQEVDLRIAPSVSKQARIENARVYSPGFVLQIAMDVTYPADCGMLQVAGSYLDSEGTRVASVTGMISGYNRNQKTHLELMPSNTAPLLNLQKAIAVASIDKLTCM